MHGEVNITGVIRVPRVAEVPDMVFFVINVVEFVDVIADLLMCGGLVQLVS